MKDLIDIYREFKKYPNVVGISSRPRFRIRKGVEVRDEKCIRVYVTRKVPEHSLEPNEIIPKKIVVDGSEICVDVVEVGILRKMQYRERYRPAPCGVSTGRADDMATGTIGWWAIDSNFNIYLLSNNHVWAKENQGRAGDPVIQPGRVDGGDPDKDVIGYLHSFVPINFSGGYNKVDVATATPADVSNLYMSIMSIGGIVGVADPSEGDRIVKVGRSTGVTEGTVIDDSATVEVEYDSGVALFTDVFIARGRCEAGDSGSPILLGRKFAGLLFAGNNSDVIVGCKQSNIVSELSNLIGRTISILVSNCDIPFRVEYIYIMQTAPDYTKVASMLLGSYMVIYTLSVVHDIAKKS